MIIRGRDFQMPKKLNMEVETATGTYGKFFAEPFERGFGTTVGNALRRVLLSSISGAAVTSVKIEGVLHEFSSVSGVKEDVADILLNVKKLRFKLHVDKPKTVHIKKKGPCVVTARDIIHDADVEVLSPDLHMTTLDKDGRLEMEMVVKIGRGYVPAEKNKEEGMPIGVVSLDAVFSPIKKVNFTVENARVGRVTDYDKLIMEVWTDGGIKPEDAIAHAAKILKEHLSIFINFDEEGEQVEATVEEKKKETNKNLLKSINELELSVRAANCLKNTNIKTVSDLVQKTESEMLKTKNFGRKSLSEIREILAEMGLHLGMKVGDLAAYQDVPDKEEG